MSKTIAIIGAGQMGSGIAQTIAQNGMDVLLADVSLELAEQAVGKIDKAFGKLVGRGKIEIAEADAAMKRLTPVGDYNRMGEAEFIIEAATEKEEIKKAIFEKAGEKLGADAIMASNTSSIPITRLAQAAPDPARFIGVHFFNPVPVMGLIELIRGLATSDATLAAVEAYGRGLGKEIVHANDAPGFIVNRVLMPLINEAIFALGEGVATMQDIDAGCRLGLNHPMGPITLADFIGLDTCLEIIRVLQSGTGDPKFRPAPLLVQYVDAGWVGKKAGRGFYDWTGTEPVPTR